MKLSKHNLILFLLLLTHFSFAKGYLLANEELLFSFETTNGKQCTIAKDKNNAYLIYRFGTKNKIEFEFPDKSPESWKKFTYSFYLRGGGIENAGLDLNYLAFTNEQVKYIIFDTYSAESNSSEIGIKVIDLKTNSTKQINGSTKSRIGSLINFRNNELVLISDELYD